MRQPLEPFPLGPLRRGDTRHDDEIVGRVEGRQLADDRAGESAGGHARTGIAVRDQNPREGSDRDRDGQVGNDGVRREKPPQRAGRHGLEVGGRIQRRPDQGHSEGLWSGADPHDPEVAIADSPLPDPAPVCFRRQRLGPQHIRFRMPVAEGGALVRDNRADAPAGAGQIPQVLPPGLHELRLAGPTRAAPVRYQHAQRRQSEDGSHHVGVRTGSLAAAEHHRRGQRASEHGQHRQPLLPTHPGRLGDRRRRLDDEITLRHRRGRPPGWALEDNRSHAARC